MKQTLSDRLKKAHDYAPSLEGQPKEKKKYDSEVLPDMRDVIEDPKTRLKLIQLVNLDAGYAAEERNIRRERKPLKETIKKLLDFKALKFMCDGNRVVSYETPRSFIDSKLLLQHGVLPSTIKACTRVTTSYTLKITPPGVQDDED